MPTDLEILDELEREIGWRIPRRDVEDGCPTLSGDLRFSSTKKRTELIFPEDVATQQGGVFLTDLQKAPAFGALLSTENKIVGLALTGLGLKHVPHTVWRVRHLRVLCFFDNDLRRVPDELRWLSELEIVGLNHNRITVVPPWVLKSGFVPTVESKNVDKMLYVGDNPLQSPPPEIIRRGLTSIRSYFSSLEGKRLPLNEVKVLLVGDGGAGKTSLAKRVRGLGFDKDEDKTPGIDINPWGVETPSRKLTVNMWDFGGQEIMHAMHLFFLSERSLYIL